MTIDRLQIQARALGNESRHQVFRYVAEAAGPVGVAELTAHFGLNHNAIRQHLAKLVEAGLLLEESARPTGRGRPPLMYTLDPTSEGRWGVAGPYERLAVLLAEVVRTGDPPEEVGRRAGLAAANPRSDDGIDSDPAATLHEQMARQGFEPTLHRGGESFTLTLENCPFLSAAATDRNAVCGLHLGLARGAAEAIGGIEIHDLEVHDPTRAGCRLHCKLTDS